MNTGGSKNKLQNVARLVEVRVPEAAVVPISSQYPWYTWELHPLLLDGAGMMVARKSVRLFVQQFEQHLAVEHIDAHRREVEVGVARDPPGFRKSSRGRASGIPGRRVPGFQQTA